MNKPLDFLNSLVKLYKVHHEDYFQMFDNVVNTFEEYTCRDITEEEELYLAGIINKTEIMTIKISYEGGICVAECFPHDIVTQGMDIPETLVRLSNQIIAEINIAGSLENIPKR